MIFSDNYCDLLTVRQDLVLAGINNFSLIVIGMKVFDLLCRWLNLLLHLDLGRTFAARLKIFGRYDVETCDSIAITDSYH